MLNNCLLKNKQTKTKYKKQQQEKRQLIERFRNIRTLYNLNIHKKKKKTDKRK